MFNGAFEEEELVLKDGDKEINRLPSRKGDYLIRDNKMHNCGSKAINVTSDAGIGGNIIIKNNTISYSSKSFWNGIAISGNNDGVVIKDNLFQSPKAPERGPWIISVNNDQTVQLSNNHIDPPHPNVPIFKEQKK